jgi:hypothetical protein
MKANGFIPLVAGLALAGCLAQPRVIDARTHPPLPPNYEWRKHVADWMKNAFADPASLRGVMVSDPVAIDTASAATWLVCLEADVRGSDGAYLGPRRFALGFLTSENKDGTGKVSTAATFIAPNDYFLGRGLSASECDRHPLHWTPWPSWQRSSEPPSPKKRPDPALKARRA